jgi:RNA polymerase sigma-70 factor (ECF subfamily)
VDLAASTRYRPPVDRSAQGVAFPRGAAIGRYYDPPRQGDIVVKADEKHETANALKGGDHADSLLVQRTLAGDTRAFDLLVIKYQRRIQRLIGRSVRDAGLVEDLTQEAFISAYRALHQFRGEAQFFTWLYRIAINTAKKRLMAMNRHPEITESSRPLTGEMDETFSRNSEPSSDETPETVLAAKEIALAVDAAVQALPEDLRQALLLREVEGLTYEDIAVKMNCPVGTVRSRIFRARDAVSGRIRPLLERQAGGRW